MGGWQHGDPSRLSRTPGATVPLSRHILRRRPWFDKNGVVFPRLAQRPANKRSFYIHGLVGQERAPSLGLHLARTRSSLADKGTARRLQQILISQASRLMQAP